MLVIGGDAGIGKTTLWLDALDHARADGAHVLSARGGQAEAGLTYSALADLLESVTTDVLDALPSLQRIAVDRVLLAGDGAGPITDERVVASALLTLLDRLAADAPVIVAIDDVHWLDSSSQAVIAFATRRLRGRVGVLVTERTDADGRQSTEWLKLNRLDGVERVTVAPLGIGGLRHVISSKLGRAFSRPTIVRISELSGGNPFYALELARAIDEQSDIVDAPLPGSLTDLVRSRLNQFSDDTQYVLLAAAGLGATTIDLLAKVIDDSAERVIELMEAPETDGIVQIAGNRVRFAHPLLARGVYSLAGPVRRRRMHRVLADVLEQPELRARHLALASSSSDPSTLLALDSAADAARERGAPAAAAELTDLALNLGGDTPARRVRAAEHHFRGGESRRAEELLTPTVDSIPPGPLRARALNLFAAIRIYDDSLPEAADLLERAIADGEGDEFLIIRSLMLSSFTYLYRGMLDDSLSRATEALAHARALSRPDQVSQALAMSVLVKCMRGNGVDEASMQRALELEDQDDDIPLQFRACAVRSITHAWTGALEAARSEAIDVYRLCLERGAESDVMAVASHMAMADVWRGDFGCAMKVADEAVERAEHIDTRHVRGVALAIRAMVLAHMGDVADARTDASTALTIAIECDTAQLAVRAMTVLGFIEVSMANYQAALDIMRPLIDSFGLMSGSEIRTLEHIPDVVEAMVNVGRIDECEPLIEKLESDGRRLDRAWLLLTGARCRAMWCAARGDLDAAMTAADAAMTESRRLAMPMERARTLLLLGQLQRRRRSKRAAAESFGAALREFEGLGATKWADRARDELRQIRIPTSTQVALTPTELKIAELATSGLTNREVAATLFISLKTVEANLTQIYRKFGIKSRAQLAAKLAAGGL